MNTQNLKVSRNLVIVGFLILALITGAIGGFLTLSIQFAVVVFLTLFTFYPMILSVAYALAGKKLNDEGKKKLESRRNVSLLTFLVSATSTGLMAWNMTSSIKFGGLVSFTLLTLFLVTLAVGYTVSLTTTKLEVE